jgi:hypothetical protein
VESKDGGLSVYDPRQMTELLSLDSLLYKPEANLRYHKPWCYYQRSPDGRGQVLSAGSSHQTFTNFGGPLPTMDGKTEILSPGPIMFPASAAACPDEKL